MSLTVCMACHLPSSALLASLPCSECLDSLLLSPPICRICLGLACTSGECLRPWMRIDGEEGNRHFDSVDSVYLSLGPGAAVLKSWKKTGSPALERHLGRGIRNLLWPPSKGSLVLVPVPQSSRRRWELSGGSVRRFSDLLLAEGRRRGTPITQIDFLEVHHSEIENQARMKGDERYRRRAAIRLRARDLINQELREKCGDENGAVSASTEILLVDDFLTSGSTLRAAAEILRTGFEDLGIFAGRGTRIGVCVLGFRPSLG